MLERPVRLWLHLRRFECRGCHHRPWEKSESFGERVQWTERLYQQVRAEFLGGCPGRELARRYGLSERTVFRWTFERSRGGRPRKLGRAIGIDEYARRKGHHYLKDARKLCRSLVLLKKQWFTGTIKLQNRCTLRQRTFHLPAAYPRIDLASLIQTDPQRFWITGRLALIDHR